MHTRDVHDSSSIHTCICTNLFACIFHNVHSPQYFICTSSGTWSAYFQTSTVHLSACKIYARYLIHPSVGTKIHEIHTTGISWFGIVLFGCFWKGSRIHIYLQSLVCNSTCDILHDIMYKTTAGCTFNGSNSSTLHMQFLVPNVPFCQFSSAFAFLCTQSAPFSQ